jgi:lipopolysaccharide export system permease protein
MTSLAWITQTLRYIPLIIEKDRSIFDFLSLTSLLYPWLLSLMAPSSLLIASVIVMDKMIRDSELVILNSSGVSPYQKNITISKNIHSNYTTNIYI